MGNGGIKHYDITLVFCCTSHTYTVHVQLMGSKGE